MIRSTFTSWQLITILLALVIPVAVSSQTKQQVIHLWEKGAPGFENRKDEP